MADVSQATRTDPAEDRIRTLAQAAEKIAAGHFKVNLPLPRETGDEIDQLTGSLDRLARSVDQRFEEMQRLASLTEKINSGLLLDEILDYVYEHFQAVIPYDRIGFSLLEDQNRTLRARWAKTSSPTPRIGRGYAASLQGSSLQAILETGSPRILNDLEAYLQEHPGSESTRLIVAEGMRSSLTCPLIAMNKPVGFMFFSSTRCNTYWNVHVEFFQRIARQLSLIVEKGRLYQDLLELNELKNRFLGMAAHDLRSPLFVVRAYLDLLLDGTPGELTANQRKALNLIGGSCSDMINMVNTLLDVNLIASGRLVLKPEPVDLASFLERHASNASLLAERKAIRFRLEQEPGLGLANLDPHRIGQVIENLVSNAFKFSQPRTEVVLRVRAAGPDLLIEVADQGPGIPEQELDKLFREFSTTSVKPSAGEKSIGLGLAICRRIMEAHGGHLSVTSRVGHGSTFTAHLPRKSVVQPAATR